MMMLGSNCSPCCQNCCTNSRWIVAPPDKCGSQVIEKLADTSIWPVGSTLSDLVSVSVDGEQESPLVVSRGIPFLSARVFAGGVIDNAKINFQIDGFSGESPVPGCLHSRFFAAVPAKQFRFSQFQQNDTSIVISVNVEINAGRYAFATFAATQTFRDGNGNFTVTREPSDISVSFAGQSVGLSYPPSSSVATTVYVGFLNSLRAEAVLRPGNSFFDLRNQVGAYATLNDAGFRGTLSGSISATNYAASRSFSVSLSDDFFEGCESCNPLP